MKKLLTACMLAALAIAAAIPVPSWAVGANLNTNTVFLLDQDNSPYTVTGTGTLLETTLKRVVLPGGLVGPNGIVRVTMLWSVTNNANSKQMKLYLGATPFFFATVSTQNANQVQAVIRNRGSMSSQIGMVNWNLTSYAGVTGANQTGSIDTSVDQFLTFACVLTNVGDSCTLESYSIEVLRP